MNKYNVRVREVLERVVEVEAVNEREAEEHVQSLYDNEEIVLDWQDLVEQEIEVVDND